MVTLGVERLVNQPESVLGDERVGLLTNFSAVDHTLTPTVHRLHDHEAIDLRTLFGPEHGLRGTAQAGVSVDDTVDDRTGLPVVSLYGDTRRPTPAMLEGIDTLVYDLQDVGTRYYTLVYTLAYALGGVAEANTRLVVLDRPNPIAPLGVSGNRIDEAFSSFVGGYRLPITHGLTVGELATYLDREFDIDANLEVVELDDWDRTTWYDETDLPWVQPSPNVPTLTTATLYPGTCLFEGTTLSEGRGTTRPFELVGAPWVDAEGWAALLGNLDLPGVGFRPATFQPSFSKHMGKPVDGVQVHLRDRDEVDPLCVGLVLLTSAFTDYEESAWLELDDGEGYFIDRLIGSDVLRKTIDERRKTDDPVDIVDDLLDEWEPDRVEFTELRERYLRY